MSKAVSKVLEYGRVSTIGTFGTTGTLGTMCLGG
jgi:hypothetical protein